MESAPRFENPIESPIEKTIEHIVQEAPIVGSGKDGIVFRLDIERLSEEEKDALIEAGVVSGDGAFAAKILKVYDPEKGDHEYRMQERAYTIVMGHVESERALCRIPEIVAVKDQHITEQTRVILNGQGAQLGDRAEILTMDFIEGKDVGTIMYDFVLLKNGFEADVVRDMSYAQKDQEVARILSFELVDREQAQSPQDLEVAQARTFARNEDTLRRYLRREGFVLDAKILETVRNTLDVLHNEGFYHGDLHKQNVMVGDDGGVYLIDFGRSGIGKEGHGLNDISFVHDWKILTMTPQEEFASVIQIHRKEIEKLVTRLRSSPRQREQITQLVQRVRRYGVEPLRSGIVTAQSNDTAFEMFLASLVVLHDDYEDIREHVDAFVQGLLSPEYKWRPFERNLIRRFVDAGVFE